MYSCMQCLIQGIPSHHFRVHVQYDDTYTAVVGTDQMAGQTDQQVYTLGHTDSCPNGHKLPSTPMQLRMDDAEQLKGTKVIQKA